MDAIFATLLVISLFAAPLGWLVWADRRRAEADTLTAEIRWAVNHRLGGESFLAVSVAPRGLFHFGRVVLSVPTGYTWLIERVTGDVARLIPPGYELVLALPSRRATATTTDAAPLARAA